MLSEKRNSDPFFKAKFTKSLVYIKLYLEKRAKTYREKKKVQLIETVSVKAREIYSHVTKDQENTNPSSGRAGWHVLKNDR